MNRIPENTELKRFLQLLDDERASDNPDLRKIAVLEYVTSQGYLYLADEYLGKKLTRIELGEHRNYLVTECPLSVRDDIGSGAGFCHTTKF